MNKQWIYRNGETPFSVTEIVMPDGSMCLTSVQVQGFLRFHYGTGKVLEGSRDLDLFPYEPYSEYEINDQVHGRHIENEKFTAGHFAGLNSEGKPTTFNFGGTSFTRHSRQVDTWNFCEKIEPTKIIHNRRSMDQ
jgi:hypothetical protein